MLTKYIYTEKKRGEKFVDFILRKREIKYNINICLFVQIMVLSLYHFYFSSSCNNIKTFLLPTLQSKSKSIKKKQTYTGSVIVASKQAGRQLSDNNLVNNKIITSRDVNV